MRYLRGLVASAVAILTLAACGGSPPSPDPVTLELQSLLKAGTAYCGQLAPGCKQQTSLVADLSATDDGQRLAVLYGDGHIVVWDLRRHLQLLHVPPGPTSRIWLTGGGTVLARELNQSVDGHNIVQLWRVSPRPGQREPQFKFLLSTEWVWLDARASRMLLLPSQSETYPGFPWNLRPSGTPGLYLLDLVHDRELAAAQDPAVPPVYGLAQPPNISPTTVEFNQASGTFIMSSTGQSGFVAWKPGSQPVATHAECDYPGTMASAGQLFACVSGPVYILSEWNVPQRHLLRQVLIPDFASDPSRTNVAAATFADGGRVLAVAEGRKPPKPYIVRLYRSSDLQPMGSLTLRTDGNQFFGIQLWAVGSSLVVEQVMQKGNVFSVFSLSA